MEGSDGVTWLAGFFFSTRAIISLLAVNIVGMEPREGAALQLALNYLLLVLVCFHSLGAGSRTLRSVVRAPAIRWVLAFLAFSLLSLAWSSTVLFSAALLYWAGLAADVGLVFVLLRAASAVGVARSMQAGFITGTCVTSVVAWIMPRQVDLRLGDMEFFNANQIGALCAFGFLLAVYRRQVFGERRTAVMIFLALTLLRSLSKTTIIAFVASGAFLLFGDRAIRLRTKLMVIVAVASCVGIFWNLFAAYYVVYTNAGNQAQTLTGRTAIWLYVLNLAVDHPWIGHGFDSMWKVVPPLGDLFEPHHAENELLQQFYAYGACGLVLTAGLYGSLFRQARRLTKSSGRFALLSILMYILIRGLAEAEPFDLLLPLWSVVLFSALAAEMEPAPVRLPDRQLVEGSPANSVDVAIASARAGAPIGSGLLRSHGTADA